jgi:hypothetical protein
MLERERKCDKVPKKPKVDEIKNKKQVQNESVIFSNFPFCRFLNCFSSYFIDVSLAYHKDRMFSMLAFRVLILTSNESFKGESKNLENIHREQSFTTKPHSPIKLSSASLRH